MGDMADYDMYENINNIGRVEEITYKCGCCKKILGNDIDEARKHVNGCETIKDKKCSR